MGIDLKRTIKRLQWLGKYDFRPTGLEILAVARNGLQKKRWQHSLIKSDSGPNEHYNLCRDSVLNKLGPNQSSVQKSEEQDNYFIKILLSEMFLKTHGLSGKDSLVATVFKSHPTVKEIIMKLKGQFLHSLTYKWTYRPTLIIEKLCF